MKTRKIIAYAVVTIITFILAYLIFHNWDAFKALIF
jgi:hypothetical protein